MLEVLRAIALLCQVQSNDMQLVKYQEQCQLNLLVCAEENKISAASASEQGSILAKCLKIKQGAK